MESAGHDSLKPCGTHWPRPRRGLLKQHTSRELVAGLLERLRWLGATPDSRQGTLTAAEGGCMTPFPGLCARTVGFARLTRVLGPARMSGVAVLGLRLGRYPQARTSRNAHAVGVYGVARQAGVNASAGPTAKRSPSWIGAASGSASWNSHRAWLCDGEVWRGFLLRPRCEV